MAVPTLRHLLALCFAVVIAYGSSKASELDSLVVRVAEIEVAPEQLERFALLAREVSSASMAREAGVICLLPLQSKECPTEFRVLEVYRDERAYAEHLKTEHFLRYKAQTADMVRALRLVPVTPLERELLASIFSKLQPTPLPSAP